MEVGVSLRACVLQIGEPNGFLFFSLLFFSSPTAESFGVSR